MDKAKTTEKPKNVALEAVNNGGVDALPQVREAVQEITPESAGSSSAVTTTGNQQKTGDAAHVTRKNNTQRRQLPSIKVQRKKVEKAISKRISYLVSRTKSYRYSKNFSAHILEQMVLEVRRLRTLLAQLTEMVAEQITILYRKYVLKVT